MKQALRLDKIYYCERCYQVFLFPSDIEDHGKTCRNCQIGEMDLV